MRRRIRARTLRGAVLLLLAACSNDPPTQPEDSNSIEGQIRTLFQPSPSERDAALSEVAAIRQQIAAGATVNARSRALALVDFAMSALRGGRLAGGSSAATGDRAARLVDALYLLVGLDPPRLPEGSLGSDGTAQVVGPAGGQVVTPSGAAGVQIPSGALDQQVLVTVTRLPTTPAPGTGPLPTTLKQYPPFYEFSTYPGVPQFGDSVRVGVCQVTDPSSPFYPPEPHSRLRLAHTVGASIGILERVGVSDFLRCSGVSANRVTLADERPGTARMFRGLANVYRMMRPAELFAAHGGLGGKVKSFSPFGAVDLGPSSYSGSVAQTGSVSYSWVVTPQCVWTTFLSAVTFSITIHGRPGVEPTFEVVAAAASATNFESVNQQGCSPPLVGTPQRHSFTGSRSASGTSITIDLTGLAGNAPGTTLTFIGAVSGAGAQITGQLTWRRIDQDPNGGLNWTLSVPITLLKQ